MDTGATDMQPSGIVRDRPEVSDARGALVKEWSEKVKEAKQHWKKDFKRMRDNMDFAMGKQWNGRADDDKYTVNLVQRLIKTAVSTLYAKNPRVIYSRRQRLDFALWDEKQDSLVQAQQSLVMASQAAATGASAALPDPNAVALLQDVQAGMQARQMADRVGRTLQVLANYYQEEQVPDFKSQAKRMVRRARTTGVGYVELDFQREMDLSDDQTTRIADMTERLATIGRMQADLQDGETDPNDAEAELLRMAIAAVQAEPERIIREGVIFNFPDSTAIIPSIDTKALIGWVGTSWLAKELQLTPERIKEVYGVDVGKSYTSYKPDGARMREKAKGLCCVWHIFDKNTGLEFVICDGYPDFLKEPASPKVRVEQFFPIWALTFNETEHEEDLFPPSDVTNMRSIQLEYNRAKEAKRQHRIANRPLYLSPKGAFDESEQISLATHAAHDVVMVNAMGERKASDLLQPVGKVGVDPNLYETEELYGDMMRVTGFQEANLGGTSNATATQSSIAQSSLNASFDSDRDELDEFLTRIWRAAGQVMLMELSADSVTQICGPGAVWPELSRLDIMQEIALEVKAGSSGRPNQAEQAAKIERLGPLLLQIPGIPPRWLAEKAVQIADDDIDLAEAYVEGLPSIMSMNRMSQVGQSDPAKDPSQQGDKGGDKTQSHRVGGTAQPGYPEQPVGGNQAPG